MEKNVQRIHCPSEEEFNERYLKPGIPVLIEGLVNSWPAAVKWTPEYLDQKWGEREVPVAAMRDGNYAQGQLAKMPLGEYLRLSGAIGSDEAMGSSIGYADNNTGLMYYLAQVSLEQNFPEMLDDVAIPDYFRNEAAGSTFLYAGGTPFSQLHYHPYGSATLSVFAGAKRVRLFAPDQGRYLYPYSMLSSKPHFSMTHHLEPDPKHFPEFSKATFIEVTVMPGEMLFFPIYFWHSIENIGFSISATTFWSRGWKSRFVPPPGPRGPYFFEPAYKTLQFGKKVVKKLSLVSGISRAG